MALNKNQNVLRKEEQKLLEGYNTLHSREIEKELKNIRQDIQAREKTINEKDKEFKDYEKGIMDSLKAEADAYMQQMQPSRDKVNGLAKERDIMLMSMERRNEFPYNAK